MNRVKYSRREYREEYLQSKEWRDLRIRFMPNERLCARCKQNTATDVHHTRYRNIVDVKMHDLVALCRDCHKLVHKAIELGLLYKSHNVKSVVRLKSCAIQSILKRRSKKIVIERWLTEKISRLLPNDKKRICGILCIPMPNDFSEFIGIVVSWYKFDQIRHIVETRPWQKEL